MADIELAAAAPQDTAQAGPVVWILSGGEMHEGGEILGVFMDRELARGTLTNEAQKLHDRFTIRDARQEDDGSIHVEGGCDWLALEPHTVITANELT